ncbi:MAG TPA: hypothetical protein VMR06_15230 [Dokdonella sp.]|uniref:hypothetical protein n=1 Tax=Dokdonella sp. TaxID=2291710 RepID=UPI002BAEB3FF|nr:hypothetical protein [Dokdonella sp.]HUD43344.1 hypothetical protein [Dokdonella sp.]
MRKRIRLLAAAMLAVAVPAAIAAPAGKTPAPAAAVEYTTLEDHVGDTVVIQTTLNTTRSGILRKYTSVVLTIELDSGIELSVPRETIRSISLAAPGRSQNTPAAGDAGAQKN